MVQDQYCREVESYLCRKNDGHLIRVVGPSFELVCGWVDRGIPLKVVCHGIDRYFERYYARGPRRRPVRVDFCEADVLDMFDEWRRAVGAVWTEQAPSTHSASPGSVAAKPRHSLAAHLDRVVGRLTARQTNPAAPALDAEIARLLERLDGMRNAAVRARGSARARLMVDLAELDAALKAASRDSCPADLLAALAHDATTDLEPFRDRLTATVYQQALDASIDRLLRGHLGLPTIAYR
jgi:hypothetical protein